MLNNDDIIMRIKGLEQICLHLSVSDYLRRAEDAEIFLILSNELQAIRADLGKREG